MLEPQIFIEQPQLLQLGQEWCRQEPAAASGIRATRWGTGVHESHVGTLWRSRGRSVIPHVPVAEITAKHFPSSLFHPLVSMRRHVGTQLCPMAPRQHCSHSGGEEPVTHWMPPVS